MPSPKVKKVRLDELVTSLGLAESRSQARSLILAGDIRLGTEVLDKPGRLVLEDLPLVRKERARFVGRGGEKLAAFFEAYPQLIEGRHILDVGASTGGFTDCLLQMGAASACCVDVGHGQLHARLRSDPRVTNLERVNARNLRADQLPRASFDLIVMDLSFISVRKVLAAVWPLLGREGILIVLVKPQFEASREEASRGKGVIRDEAVRTRVLAEVKTFVETELAGAREVGCLPSPIAGSDGNREYLVGWRKEIVGEESG